VREDITRLPMTVQFTQQLLTGEDLCTFLFTQNHIGDNESVYTVRALNNDAIKPFTMYYVNGRYEIMNDAIPVEVKNIKFQLSQAISNYHIMQSLLQMPDNLDDFDQIRRVVVREKNG
jgi:hypothetical protein